MDKRGKETRVVNVSNEDYDVYIGRGSQYGNPFKIGPDGNRNEVIKKYEMWLRNSSDLLYYLYNLQGKRLGCHCKPKACHGDILVKMLKEKKCDEWFNR